MSTHSGVVNVEIYMLSDLREKSLTWNARTPQNVQGQNENDMKELLEYVKELYETCALSEYAYENLLSLIEAAFSKQDVQNEQAKRTETQAGTQRTRAAR